jgi:hypothetical protein
MYSLVMLSIPKDKEKEWVMTKGVAVPDARIVCTIKNNDDKPFEMESKQFSSMYLVMILSKNSLLAESVAVGSLLDNGTSSEGDVVSPALGTGRKKAPPRASIANSLLGGQAAGRSRVGTLVGAPSRRYTTLTGPVTPLSPPPTTTGEIAKENEEAETSLLDDFQSVAIHYGLMERYEVGKVYSGQWVETWFVLCRNGLWYCKPAIKDRELSYIPLGEHATTNVTGENTFQINGGTQVLSLRCMDNLDMVSWTDSIENRLTMTSENDIITSIEHSIVDEHAKYLDSIDLAMKCCDGLPAILMSYRFRHAFLHFVTSSSGATATDTYTPFTDMVVYWTLMEAYINKQHFDQSVDATQTDAFLECVLSSLKEEYFVDGKMKAMLQGSKPDIAMELNDIKKSSQVSIDLMQKLQSRVLKVLESLFLEGFIASSAFKDLKLKTYAGIGVNETNCPALPAATATSSGEIRVPAVGIKGDLPGTFGTSESTNDKRGGCQHWFTILQNVTVTPTRSNAALRKSSSISAPSPSSGETSRTSGNPSNSSLGKGRSSSFEDALTSPTAVILDFNVEALNTGSSHSLSGPALPPLSLSSWPPFKGGMFEPHKVVCAQYLSRKKFFPGESVPTSGMWVRVFIVLLDIGELRMYQDDQCHGAPVASFHIVDHCHYCKESSSLENSVEIAVDDTLWILQCEGEEAFHSLLDEIKKIMPAFRMNSGILIKEDETKMLYEGNIFKRGKFNTSWKLRRFRLLNNGLMTYYDVEHNTLLGTIALADNIMDVFSDHGSDGTAADATTGCRFSLVVPGRQYHFRTENAKDMRIWVVILNRFKSSRRRRTSTLATPLAASHPVARSGSIISSEGSAPWKSFSSPHSTSPLDREGST